MQYDNFIVHKKGLPNKQTMTNLMWLYVSLFIRIQLIKFTGHLKEHISIYKRNATEGEMLEFQLKTGYPQ